MSTWLNNLLQEPMSPTMEQMLKFHDHTMMILSMITIIVLYMMMSMLMNKTTNRFMLEEQTIELIWTLIPAFTLIFIAMPSIQLLYLMEEMKNPALTIKSIGHQWYWSYEYSDFKNIEFDSYMKPSLDLMDNEFRLLDVDNRIILPKNNQIRMLITAADVLHSWAMPSLSIKIDATPGRINQGGFNILRSGLMYGQCSEICGANHSFMPIVIESIPTEDFINWIKNQ
uniref:Cytochrome c oxidase subunit 2 n=1 Tax=Helotrephes sp. NKMT027 TaxID=1320099 RepID=C5HIW7_9HEMI|nr:cytochrome c oxidase subunit II [Helotrephes sp. NKMT027]ACJ69562.1 cytochrome c oxidase subunit II [Helotrephes sp. NKMT027]